MPTTSYPDMRRVANEERSLSSRRDVGTAGSGGKIRAVANRIRYRDRLTRLGLHFLFVALFAIIGGSLRGFNLLLLLAGLLVSVVIVQWRCAHASIRRVSVTRRPIAGGHVGEAIEVGYLVKNRSRFIPAAFVQIEEALVPADGDDDEDQYTIHAAIGTVDSEQTGLTGAECRFQNRGVFRIGPTIASTTFPFALTVSERVVMNSQQSLFVYPRLLTLRGRWQRLLPPRPGGDGDRSTSGTSYQGDFYGLRPWQSGDHIRHIHWRTTARIGEPAVRQFEQRHQHRICCVVDGPATETDATENFEDLLSLAATLIVELGQAGIPTSLLVSDGLTTFTSQDSLYYSKGSDNHRLLERLAIAEPIVPGQSDRSNRSDRLMRAISAVGSQLARQDLVIVSHRRLKDVMRLHSKAGGRQATAAAATMPDWHQLARGGRLSWLCIESPEVQRYVDFQDPTKNRRGQPKGGRLL
ncbi:DUF58 domain-containing protein [Roseiconus lacunae]|uniref:DUF58 domain-containing protein n=1 Tax=Roseiconus lacunae TaxID=2605694 RepID=UPI003088E25E|nr:DUF58 domain-containing protein [Stieleria sp. HD01]